MSTRNVLTVFIASPSDLDPERRKTFEVVSEVNRIIKAGLNWSIDLLGWEDTLPGVGRPQAIINWDVEKCDLFIGLLWRRWGTPSGAFSSGFEEEFTLATNRRKTASLPEMWMFFKTVESAQRIDAGPELLRVIAFRNSLVASKTMFFKEFDDISEWEKMLRECLLKYVFEIASAPTNIPEGTSQRAATPTEDRATEEASAETPEAGKQIAALAESLQPAFKTGELTAISEKLNDSEQATFLAVRSLLMSAALVSAAGEVSSPLPIREMNTLYLYRDRLRATVGELHVLFRTLWADHYQLTPGWYWLKNDSEIDFRLALAALFDEEATVRAKSFEVLRRESLSLFTIIREDVIERRLPHIPSDTRDEAWAYLVDITKPEDITLLTTWAPDSWLESRIQWLKLWVETGRDLDAFLTTIPDPQLITEPMRLSIVESIGQLSEDALQALTTMSLANLAKPAVAELERRGLLIRDSKFKLQMNPQQMSIGSLMMGLSAPINLIAPPKPENTATDQQRYERLSGEDNDSLRKSLEWTSLDGPPSYQLLIERGQIGRDIVRTDLLEEFSRIRDDYYSQIEKEFGPEAAVRYHETFDKYKQMFTRLFSAAALAALAKEPGSEDVEPARLFLNDHLTRSDALRIIAHAATETDLNYFIRFASTSFGDERKLALETIQRIAPDKIVAAKQLVALDARDMSYAALSLVRELGDQQALPFLEELLLDENDGIRIAALAQIRKRLNNAGLVELLARYTRGTYFYNVVAWIDRLVYAPTPILNYYRSEFEKRLNAQEQ